MLKLKCGWKLPDELGFIVDVDYEHRSERDDLVTSEEFTNQNAGRCSVLTIKPLRNGHYEVDMYISGYEATTPSSTVNVTTYAEFIYTLCNVGYTPALSVLRQVKIDNLLD